MTKLLQGEALERYMREIADQMGLKDWRIILETEEPEDGAMGTCETATGQKVATIRIKNHGTDADELRNTVVHELLHAHFNAIREPINNVRSAVGDLVYWPIYYGVTDHVELAIDGIATAWAESFPLPIKAKKRKDKAA